LLLADQAGHPLDFDRFDPDMFLNAMVTSFNADERPLVALIGGLIADE
jgi:cell filamentation protein